MQLIQIAVVQGLSSKDDKHRDYREKVYALTDTGDLFLGQYVWNARTDSYTFAWDDLPLPLMPRSAYGAG